MLSLYHPAIWEFGVRKIFYEGGKIVLLYFPPLDVYSKWRVLLCIILCSFELIIDAGKYLKNNTHSYLCILSNITNNNWFVCILCYCKSNIDTGKIPS